MDKNITWLINDVFIIVIGGFLFKYLNFNKITSSFVSKSNIEYLRNKELDRNVRTQNSWQIGIFQTMKNVEVQFFY